MTVFFNDDRIAFFVFYKSGAKYAYFSLALFIYFLSMSKRLFCLKSSLLSHKNQTFNKNKKRHSPLSYWILFLKWKFIKRIIYFVLLRNIFLAAAITRSKLFK